MGQCIQLYFSARTSDVLTKFDVFVLSALPFQSQQLLAAGSTPDADAFVLFDERCRLDLQEDATELTLDFDISPFDENSWVDVDAMYLGLEDCEEGDAPPCFMN